MDGIVKSPSITRNAEEPGVVDMAKKNEAIRAKERVRRSYKQIWAEKVFKRSLVIIALAMIVLVLGIALTLVIESIPSIKNLGIGYLWGKTWDPVADVYGAFP